jgi:hypothetical protein
LRLRSTQQICLSVLLPACLQVVLEYCYRCGGLDGGLAPVPALSPSSPFVLIPFKSELCHRAGQTCLARDQAVVVCGWSAATNDDTDDKDNDDGAELSTAQSRRRQDARSLGFDVAHSTRMLHGRSLSVRRRLAIAACDLLAATVASLPPLPVHPPDQLSAVSVLKNVQPAEMPDTLC